jgi:hypothetical protein
MEQETEATSEKQDNIQQDFLEDHRAMKRRVEPEAEE